MDLSYLTILDPVKGQFGKAIILLVTSIYMNVSIFGDKSVYPENSAAEILNEHNPVFDFVIVGTGTSGCLMANRLSQNPNFKILLVEAGDYPSPTTDVPKLYFDLENTDEDWKFELVQGEHGCLGREQGCMLSRGKVLGGTTSINNMHYYRGTERGFNDWQMPGWMAKDTNGFFQNIERYIGKVRTPFEVSTKGNITLNYFKADHFLRKPLSLMYEEAGYKPLQTGKYVGYRDMLVTAHKGFRINMAKVFLSPIKERKNFKLALKTIATKIILTDNQDRRVRAVELLFNGKRKKTIRIRKELILCAGSVNNAKILMLSGIGPREHLESLDIPVMADLPVGSNFQMHIRVPLFVAIDKCCGRCLNCSTPDCQNDFFNLKRHYQSTWDFLTDHIGDYTTTGINDFVAYVDVSRHKLSYPNVVVHHNYFKRNSPLIKEFFSNRKLVPSILEMILRHNKHRNLMTFYPTLLTPKSRGKVSLRSTDPMDPPIIKPNFLTDSGGDDFRILYSACAMLCALIESEPMRRYKAKMVDIDIPNCRHLKFCTQEYFRCVIINLAAPTTTVCGTCRMGPENSNTTVVNGELKVKFTRGLRVGDSSVAPNLLRANMLSSDALFAEKLSDLLRRRWEPNYLSPYRPKTLALNILKER